MEGKMPVLAATDPNTDVGTVIEEGKFGYWCESNDSEKFVKLMELFQEQNERIRMGDNAFDYLKNNYDVADSYSIIISHIKNIQ